MGKNSGGFPDRHIMVSVAVDMERHGFTWKEFETISRLCESSAAIRGYAISFMADLLDMWDGLVPHRGSFSYELAFIAASRLCEKCYRSLGRERMRMLMGDPEEWSEEEYQAARERYVAFHPDSRRAWRMTKKLRTSLEADAHNRYGEECGDCVGSNVIPFSAIRSRR